MRDGHFNSTTKEFELIFNHHYILIFSITRQFLQDEQEAKDITASTFLKLWEHRAQLDFNNHAIIYSWLKITARNACLDHLKKLQRNAERQDELIQHIENQAEEIYELGDKEAKIINLLNKEIERLPQECRKIFKMRYQDDLGLPEIAEILKISVRTVRNQHTTALKKLRKKLPFPLNNLYRE